MKTNYCSINFVLDRSGSMESIRDDVIGGFNAFIRDQQSLTGECDISLYQFDDIYDVVYENKNIKNAPFLTKEIYIPRNSTALLDAIGRTINKVGHRFSLMNENARPDKVLLVIFSDGLENASHEFTRDKIFEMIKHQREVYNWQIIFLGANQDAIATAANYGIGKSSTLTYAATSLGTNLAYASMTNSVTAMRCGVTNNVSFSDEDRRKQQAEINKMTTTVN